MHWRRKWQLTPVFLPGESQGRWAAIYGVAQSWTQLKRLSSSSLSTNWKAKLNQGAKWVIKQKNNNKNNKYVERIGKKE